MKSGPPLSQIYPIVDITLSKLSPNFKNNRQNMNTVLLYCLAPSDKWVNWTFFAKTYTKVWKLFLYHVFERSKLGHRQWRMSHTTWLKSISKTSALIPWFAISGQFGQNYPKLTPSNILCHSMDFYIFKDMWPTTRKGEMQWHERTHMCVSEKKFQVTRMSRRSDAQGSLSCLENELKNARSQTKETSNVCTISIE